MTTKSTAYIGSAYPVLSKLVKNRPKHSMFKIGSVNGGGQILVHNLIYTPYMT